MMVCPRCGHEYPAALARCRICGAPRPPLPPGAAPAEEEGPLAASPLPVPALHAARTLLVPEELIEDFHLQPSKARQCPATLPGAPGAASPSPQPGSEDGGALGAVFSPLPVPVPPGDPGPWQIPTDRPRPIRPMRRVPVEQSIPGAADISLPEPVEGRPPGPAPAGNAPGGAAGPKPVPPGAKMPVVIGAELLLEDHGGLVIQQLDLPLGLTRLGRSGGEILFAGDPFVAPVHAWIVVGRRGVRLRDAGSANGIYLHRTGETLLEDGDALLVGSQLLLFRDRWTEREADGEGTSLFGSAGWTSAARLVNLRQGGDVVHVHVLDGDLIIGREVEGSPYRSDRYLARQHLGVEPSARGVTVRDLSGGRGYFLRLRGEQQLADGQTFVIGSRLLRLRMRYRS